MADNNQNPNLGGNTNAARDQLDISRQVRKEQGDYRDYLKESEALLRKMVKSYDSIEGKIQSLNRGTINTKEINKLLQKAREEDFNLQKKINEFEKDTNSTRSRGFSQYQQSLDNIKGLEKDIIEAKKEGNLTNLKAAQFLLQEQIQIRDTQFEILDVEEQSYANNLKSKELSDERLKFTEKQLEVEKNIAKQVGFTGSLLKTVGKIYPKAGQLYEKIVEETRAGVSTTSNWTKGIVLFGAAIAGIYKVAQKSFEVIASGVTSLTGSGGPMSKLVAPFTNIIKQIPVVGGLIGSIADLGANLVDFATGANSETQKFARNLGISLKEAKDLNNEFDSIARNTGSAYLNIEKFRKSQIELSTALGLNEKFSSEILAADAKLAEQVGLELDTRKDLAAVAKIQRTDQVKIFLNIQSQTKFLKEQLGVNIRLQDTIKKAASLGGVLGLTFAKYPEKLTKALLVTKALGIDLQKLDSIANGLLDFESSIANEFEAQLLTGKNINLQKARELALNNDLAGLALEINTQLGSSEEFLNMNRIQQESISKAVGMTRDELADTLKQQALFAAIGAKTEKQFKDKIQLMKQQGTLQSEFLSKLKEEELQYYLSSTSTETIANFIEKMKQSFANLLNNESFKKFIDTVMEKLSDPNFINDILDKLTSFANLIVKITSYMLYGIGALVDAADYLTGGFIIPNEIPKGLMELGENLNSYTIGGNVLRSQVSGTSSGGSTANAQVQSGNQNINLNVTAQLNDHYKMADVRLSTSPGRERQTGNGPLK